MSVRLLCAKKSGNKKFGLSAITSLGRTTPMRCRQSSRLFYLRLPAAPLGLQRCLERFPQFERPCSQEVPRHCLKQKTKLELTFA